MAFDVEGAKQAGYSDAEINSYLAKESNFDIRGARRAGYKDDEILKHLTSIAPPKQKEAPPVEPPKIEPKPEDQSVFRQVADVPLKLGSGLVTGVRMVADAFGADTGVSKTLRGVEDDIASLYSAQSKKDSGEIARIMKEAEDKGVLDQIIAGVKAMSVAPVDIIANSLGTAAPAITAGLLTTLTGGAPLVVAGAGLGTGAVMGAGTVKSAIYDATKQVLTEKTKMTPEQIEAAAVKAQEYGGKNLDQILLGTAIGAVGARTGVEPVIARQLAKDIVGRASAQEAAASVAVQATGREVAKAAVKAATEEETKKAAERGAVRQGAITAAKEFATEFPQGGQEQLAQNLALQREGFDVPTMRGVVSQGTMEGLAGAGMGAAAGAREGFTAERDKDVSDYYKSLVEKAKDIKQEKSESPIVGTSTVNVDGKESQKITRKDGSVEIDGVQVVPPTNKEPTTDTSASSARNLTISEAGQETTTATPVAEKSPAIQRAEEYIAKIDSGEVKPNPATLGAMLTNLGIERPEGKGFREKAVEAIKNHLAGQGAPDVAGTVTDTSGTSAKVVSQPVSDNTARGTAATQFGGMDSTGAPATNVGAGTRTQPAPLVTAGQTKSYIKAEFPDVFPGYKYDPTKSESENTQAAMQLQTENERTQEEQRLQLLTDVRVKALKEQQEADKRAADGKRPKIVEFKVTPAKQAEYERTRQKLAEEGTTIPAWKDLSQLQKKIYFDFVKSTTYSGTEAAEREHNIAGRELAAFMEKSGRGKGYNQESTTEKEQEVSFTYNRSRTDYNKKYGVSFPEWNTLSAEAKKIYNDRIGSNTPVEQDLASAYLGLHLAEVGGKMNAAQRQKAEANIAELKRRAQQTEEETKTEGFTAGFDKPSAPMTGEQERELDERVARIIEEQEKQKALPVEVLKHIRDGNLQGVLQYLRTKAKSAIHKQLAQKLFSLKLGTKIELVASLPNNDLAVYDPDRNVIQVTPEGLSDMVMLHEVVHAATIKILRAFETNPKSLTEEQRDAVDHIKDIMEIAKKELGDAYPDAFKNIYEFVSYAMTDKLFQSELAQLSTKDLVSTLLPDNKSMWSEFVVSLSKLFDFFKGMFTKAGDVKAENLVPELFAAFEAIVAVPEGGIKMAPLPIAAKVKGAKVSKEVPEVVASLNDRTSDANALYKLKSDQKPNTPFRALVNSMTSTAGWQNMARLFQSTSYPIRVLEQQLAKANMLYRVGKDAINNLHEQITIASSLARNYHNQHLKQHVDELNSAVSAYAQAAGITSEEALIDLHKVLEALHEPERRLVKYILSVPLENTKKNLTFNGKQYTAAELREEIRKVLNEPATTEDEARQLRKGLDSIIFKTDANGDVVYKDGYPQPNVKYVDAAGYSPSGTKEISVNALDFKVTALDQNSVKNITDEYDNNEFKDEMDRVRAAVQSVHEATKVLNKIGNYWSQPVSNRVAFYGWENYIPLKGIANQTSIDEELDFDSRKMGRDLQDNAGSFDGRISVSRNPILQTMSDGVRSALRAGRRDLTQTIKNLLPESKLNPNGQGHLQGEVVLHIPFEERDIVDLRKYKGETTIFHYNSDGSIDILRVDGKNMQNAIRRSYEQINPLIELANKITGGVGMLHTRYNYQFAPLNFVRDALTNAFTIGAEMGPIEAARFLTSVSTQVTVKAGLYKAMQVAILYNKGDGESNARLEALKKRDPYINDMVEMIQEGGLVSYLQGLGLKSNFVELHKSIGKNGIITKLEDFNKFVDIWTDMFEIASRGAAYGIVKQNFYTKNLANKMSEKDAMEAAKVEAAAYTKNLANFEQVGEFGKTMGAFYMFFRPAATGAVRALEALAPAWPGSLERALLNLPNSIRDDKEAVDAFKKNYKEMQRNARVTTGALFGLGMLAYSMAYMTADDDDFGRNAVATDNMDQWTRYLRFHIPQKITEAMGIKDPVVFQIPWGFGLGAFAAAGAQVAAMTSGHESPRQALSNIFTSITLDSFIPIPVSKMPATEMPLEFLLDSIAPSVARPLLEFALNKNGLGQAIYNDQNRRMGDAYTGGEKIPELYKDVSRGIAEASTGAIDVTPNTLYFLSNSYIDGIGRVFEAAYGMPAVIKGDKNFNPKTDLPLMGSFFGARSNFDSREFSSVENKIKDMERKINMFDKANPLVSAQYDMKNPFDRMLVDIYNAQLNQQLNPLRAKAKEIKLMPGLTPNTRSDMLKIITLQENLVKRNMIETFKAYGLKP